MSLCVPDKNLACSEPGENTTQAGHAGPGSSDPYAFQTVGCGSKTKGLQANVSPFGTSPLKSKKVFTE